MHIHLLSHLRMWHPISFKKMEVASPSHPGRCRCHIPISLKKVEVPSPHNLSRLHV